MKKLLLALLATSAVAGAAQAQTTTPHAYIGVGAATADNQTTDSYKTGATVYGGYEVDQNWGVEAGYTDFGKENNGAGNVKGSGTYVAGKYTVPLGDRFSGYGKLGVAYNERKFDNGLGTHVNDYDTGLYGGVGVEYKLNEKLAVNAEYERYGKDKAFGAKADVYTVGLKYGF
jgi:OOP family OmpA-OmpF porin